MGTKYGGGGAWSAQSGEAATQPPLVALSEAEVVAHLWSGPNAIARRCLATARRFVCPGASSAKATKKRAAANNPHPNADTLTSMDVRRPGHLPKGSYRSRLRALRPVASAASRRAMPAETRRCLRFQELASTPLGTAAAARAALRQISAMLRATGPEHAAMADLVLLYASTERCGALRRRSVPCFLFLTSSPRSCGNCVSPRCVPPSHRFASVPSAWADPLPPLAFLAPSTSSSRLPNARSWFRAVSLETFKSAPVSFEGDDRVPPNLQRAEQVPPCADMRGGRGCDIARRSPPMSADGLLVVRLLSPFSQHSFTELSQFVCLSMALQGSDAEKFLSRRYGGQYCWGQLVSWYKQTIYNPEASLSAERRGTMSLPDPESAYGNPKSYWSKVHARHRRIGSSAYWPFAVGSRAPAWRYALAPLRAACRGRPTLTSSVPPLFCRNASRCWI